MDQVQDRNLVFNELLSQFIDKIKKNLPKKYIKLREILNKLSDMLQESSSLVANQYFILIKLSIETKVSKLIDISLYYLQKLIQGNFFNEKIYEKLFSINDNQQIHNEINQQLFLAMIDILCQTSNEKDENIQLLVINTSSVIIENYNVHGIQLIKLFRVCIHINSLTKNQIIQNQAKSALFNKINNIYEKLIYKDEPEIEDNKTDDFIQDIINNCINEAHYEVQQKNIIMKRQKSFDNMVNIFDNLCKLSSKDQSYSDINPYTLKCKVITLELIMKILDTPNNIFQQDVKIIYLLKECLCDTLLKNALCQEKQVFVQSFNIFVFLVQNFREHLKLEIATFVETVFLKILDSFNSSFNHIIFSLQVFQKILQNPEATLEFYVNYDCAEDSPFIIQKIIDNLVKIAQGKYAKNTFQASILASQELILKKIAIQSLVNLIKGLKEYHQKLIQSDQIKTSQRQNTEADEQTYVESEQTVDDQVFEEFEKKRILKIKILQAIKKFNFKPKSGLKHMIELDVIVKDNAQSLALFIFKNKEHFSKMMLGEFFGDENPYNVQVLADFTDMVDLQQMNIDEAMRHYLQYFQLPGEGQKVDRIMQHFSVKFYKDNPDSVFTHADAAYTLSYLMMMLQTELHNAQVEKPMTLEQFIKLAKGINNGSDLPFEYMQQLYTSIGKKQLALHEKEEAKLILNEALNSSVRKKQDLFFAESEKIIRAGQKQLKTSQESIFVKVNTDEYIKPVLQICSFPLLATFSSIFTEQDDTQIIQLLLDSLQDQINLTSYFGLSTERDALVIALTNQVQFGNKDKHVQCIQTILNVANYNGDLLNQSWYYILQFLSKLQNLYNQYSTRSDINQIQFKNAEFIFQIIDNSEIDIIFNNSVKLKTDAVLEFIRQLTIMSKEELTNKSPTLFGLQKVVEIADLNMSRIKIIWSRIWDLIKEHFNHAGCHENMQVSMYAIDSLKQLSLNFLKKGEMNHFQGQRDFLQPFQTIYENVQHNKYEIKDFILCCLQYICQCCNQDLKSGWKIILNVINASFNDENEKLVVVGFNILDRMIKENYSQIQEFMNDIIITQIKFFKTQNQNIINQSIENIQQVKIKYQKILEKLHTSMQQSQNKNQEYEKILQKSLMLVLNNLSTLYSDSRIEIQQKSIQCLFETIKKYGNLFQKEYWVMIVKGVFKSLFDEITFSFQNNKNNQNNNNKNVAIMSFNYLQDIFNMYYESIIFVYTDFLEILLKCIESLILQLVQMSLNCFRFILVQSAKEFKEEQWKASFNFIKKVLSKTYPKQLLQFQEKEKKIHTERCITQCTVQLLSIQLIKQICELHFELLPQEIINEMLDEVQKSLKTGREFNTQIQKRYNLWKSGFLSDVKLLPGLNKQEQESLSTFIFIIFKLYKQNQTKENLDKFLSNSIEVFEVFISRNDRYMQSKKFGDQVKDSDSIDIVIKKLENKELERDITHMKQILFENILDNLREIQIENLKPYFQELTDNFMKIQECQFNNKQLFDNSQENNQQSWTKIREFIRDIIIYLNK